MQMLKKMNSLVCVCLKKKRDEAHFLAEGIPFKVGICFANIRPCELPKELNLGSPIKVQ